jgi:hypothetical protein
VGDLWEDQTSAETELVGLLSQWAIQVEPDCQHQLKQNKPATTRNKKKQERDLAV